MNGRFNALGVAIQHFPPARKIPFDIFFATNFTVPTEVFQVLGGSDEFGKYAPQMQKLRNGMAVTFREDFLTLLDELITGKSISPHLQQRAMDRRNTMVRFLKDLNLKGTGGVIIGLGVMTGGMLLSADTVHASETNEDPIPIYWTLTQEELEAYQEKILSEKAFWSNLLQQQGSTTSIFGL